MYEEWKRKKEEKKEYYQKENTSHKNMLKNFLKNFCKDIYLSKKAFLFSYKNNFHKSNITNSLKVLSALKQIVFVFQLS